MPRVAADDATKLPREGQQQIGLSRLVTDYVVVGMLQPELALHLNEQAGEQRRLERKVS